MINILVSGVGSLLGQGIIKTIQKSKFKTRIIGTDYFNTAVGLYWVKKGYILPDILNSSHLINKWNDKIINICNKENIDLLIPGLDFEIPVLCQYKSLIEKKTKTKILVSSNNVIKIANDKWETVKFLKKNKCLYPKSCLPKNINKFILKNKFPLIVKPRHGHTSKNIYIVNNLKKLNESIKKCKNPIIQEYIGGENNEYTCGSIFIKDNVIAVISLKRKLKNGNTAIAFNNNNNKLNNYIKKITKVLKPFGPTNFQLKLTKKVKIDS